MGRFLLKRFGLAIVTLVLLSIIAFAAAQLLPGNVGRNVLGGFATQQSVDLFNHQHGVYGPVYSQYGRWIGHLLHGNLGTSLEYNVPVSGLIGPALRNSFQPVLFGYIARMARAGTIEALDADYTRTAVLKGLSKRTVLRKHVLRNALLPTIAVVATQVGYLIGGLIVIEKLFNYPGIGLRIYTAAQNKDFTMLETGVLIVGIVYLVATLIADLLYSLLNPRIRYGAAE